MHARGEFMLHFTATGAVATVAKMYSLLLEVQEKRIIYSTMKEQKRNILSLFC
jgi:hypothetical protein